MVIRSLFTMMRLGYVLNSLIEILKPKIMGVSISLTGEDKSGYAYYAVLKYKGIKIEFLVHPDMSWGLEDTVIASREGQYCYFSAWNLWVELFGIG